MSCTKGDQCTKSCATCTGRAKDTITDDDLPGLRAELCGYAATEQFTPEFRAICRETIAAIDLAVAEAAATNLRLKLALERFVAVGNLEPVPC